MKRLIVILIGIILPAVVFANTLPTVTNVTVSQRTDGSGIVDISYMLSDADNDRCTVTVLASSDGGSTWTTTPSPSAISGDLTNVLPGSRHITWNSKLDLPGVFGSNYRITVTADDGGIDTMPITWISINDPGFIGQMSKYETTNLQYCQFLNTAKASGDITVDGNNVIGASGFNSGVDFVGQVYYNLAGAGYSIDGANNGGATRIHYRSGFFIVDSGFENHPVTYVSWYGATAFCNYYGYRLPTQLEWQAVADYDGSFTYGCGATITNSMANYLGTHHQYGTTAVGAIGNHDGYGYGMCDMAGNVWEWTSTVSGSYRVLCGGSWYINSSYCYIYGVNGIDLPNYTYFSHGFRVCEIVASKS